MTIQPTPTAEDLQAAQALMEQLQNPQWTLAAAQLEDELGCDIGAGIPDHQLGKFLSDPVAFLEHQRLQTLVFQGLYQLLLECNLGAGLAAAHATGKQQLIERLQQPSAEIQQQLLSLLAEDLSKPQDEPLSPAVQSSLRQVIQSILSADDWDAISSAAVHSLQQHFRAVVMRLPQIASCRVSEKTLRAACEPSPVTPRQRSVTP